MIFGQVAEADNDSWRGSYLMRLGTAYIWLWTVVVSSPIPPGCYPGCVSPMSEHPWPEDIWPIIDTDIPE